jgi:hypothetical protein
MAWGDHTIERLTKVVKRRSAVVGISPNRGAALRLVGARSAERGDEWHDGRRYVSEPSMRQSLQPPTDAAEAWAAPMALSTTCGDTVGTHPVARSAAPPLPHVLGLDRDPGAGAARVDPDPARRAAAAAGTARPPRLALGPDFA